MGREVENVEFKGSRRRRETRIYARASDAALPIPCPPLQKYCNTRDICRPREEKGTKRKRGNVRVGQTSPSKKARPWFVWLARLKRGGEFAFLFAGLKLYPLRGRRGLNRLLGRLKRNVAKRKEKERGEGKGNNAAYPVN